MSTPPSPASLELNRKRRRLKAAIFIVVLTIIVLLGSAAMLSNRDLSPYLAITALALGLAVLPRLSWKYLLDYRS